MRNFGNIDVAVATGRAEWRSAFVAFAAGFQRGIDVLRRDCPMGPGMAAGLTMAAVVASQVVENWERIVEAIEGEEGPGLL